MIAGNTPKRGRNTKQDSRIAEELGDLRNQGVTLGQLGTLAMREGKLDEAQARYRAALALFQQLREPAMEAVAWHQLGMVYQKAQQWDEAERHYREAARIKEENGLIARPTALDTWNQLAIVSEAAGKPEAAEGWYRKAIEGFRSFSDQYSLSICLSNLADLLQTQPDRLSEARQLAEEALAIEKTLDPDAAQIWTTYTHSREDRGQGGRPHGGQPPAGGTSSGGAGTPPARSRSQTQLRRHAAGAAEAPPADPRDLDGRPGLRSNKRISMPF